MNFEKSVIFIDQDKINYYDRSLPAVLTFPFTKELISDLEVVNSAALHLQIKSFVDNNKITPSQMMVVLSPNVYFEKEFPETAEFHQDSELQKFIDTIPFENISTKIYKLAAGSRLLATNSDLYQNIKTAFENVGFIIEAVVPVFILGKDITIVNNLDTREAGTMLERFDLAKQNSLLLHQDGYAKSQIQKGGEKHKKEDNKTLIFLIPILITLIIVLFILYLKTNNPV